MGYSIIATTLPLKEWEVALLAEALVIIMLEDLVSTSSLLLVEDCFLELPTLPQEEACSTTASLKTQIPVVASSPEVKMPPNSKILVDYLATTISSRKILVQEVDYSLQIQLNRIIPEVDSLASSQSKSNLAEVFSALKEVVFLDNLTSQLK